jgi:hypothetical protein
MKVFIPTTYDKRSDYPSARFSVVEPLSGSTIELPKAFAERKAGSGNDVCHIKMLSGKLFTASGSPILWGWKANDDHPVRYHREFWYATYTSRCAIYAYCSFLADTPGQIINGNRYSVEIRLHGEEENRYGEIRRVMNEHSFSVYVRPLGSQEPGGASSDGSPLRDAAKAMRDHFAYDYVLPSYVYNDRHDDAELLRVFSDVVAYYTDNFYQYDEPTRAWQEYWPVKKEKVAAKATISLPTGSLFSKLRLDEYNLVFDKAYSTVPFAAYHIHALQQGAYLDCLDHVPQMNENSLANIAEVVRLLKGIIIDHKVDVPDSLSSLWLSYRYQYGTGKSDLEDAISFQKRVVDGALFHRGFSCYGISKEVIDDVLITCRCHIRMTQKELDYLEKISTGLYRYGLSPSFYVIWDMIPYSFIVDWFIPVGDMLSALDKRRMYDRTYTMSDIWFSLSYETKDDEGSYKAYTRWASSDLPEFQGYYSLENIGTPSNKTIGFRILDTLSLLFR